MRSRQDGGQPELASEAAPGGQEQNPGERVAQQTAGRQSATGEGKTKTKANAKKKKRKHSFDSIFEFGKFGVGS